MSPIQRTKDKDENNEGIKGNVCRVKGKGTRMVIKDVIKETDGRRERKRKVKEEYIKHEEGRKMKRLRRKKIGMEC